MYKHTSIRVKRYVLSRVFDEEPAGETASGRTTGDSRFLNDSLRYCSDNKKGPRFGVAP